MNEPQYDDEQSVLIKRAVFGKQVEAFFNSEIGKYLMDRANDDIIDAFNKIKTCDPKDGKVVQHLQNQMYRAESIRNWLEDAVNDGLMAINVIDSPD